ncbi:carboxymuconolactone decarboxylase family protein [Trinickia sp. NRRL B-1857]|uniref:carboxymuconolactone decarboxylase family protein n=1 Tax=Trinickia sp. NRRL B-1857 TaxID=3162879 RepID=UPI003D2B2702
MQDGQQQPEYVEKSASGGVSNKLASAVRAWRRSWSAGSRRRGKSGQRDRHTGIRADGLAALEAIGGEKGDALVGTLQRLSPEFARLLIEQIYGEVISRPALSLKDRELVTVAILVALGDVPSALDLHCVGMLRTGWTPREMTQVILLAAVGAEMRSFEASMVVARNVVAKSRGRAGATLREPGHAQPIPEDIREMAYLLFGASRHTDVLLALEGIETWEGMPLGPRDRRLVELSRTLARGNERSAIASHLERCLLAGWTQEQLVELLMHMTVYAGWPLTLNALQPATATFERFSAQKT